MCKQEVEVAITKHFHQVIICNYNHSAILTPQHFRLHKFRYNLVSLL